ncbi:MAG: Ada metal-binding domain-containing protein, partial [Bdellovibrionota bacterium]
MLARDHRFDGKFFIAVKTTKIYCRPICPAKPLRKNVEFFSNHLEAEKAGYRPCLRCRPESAPRSPAWIGKSAVVQRAVKVLTDQASLSLDENKFADQFGVTARHLRRLFNEEIGKTPKQLSAENRLNLARKLLSETGLQISEIAFASGFSSIRRFNDAFKDRFKRKPSEIRRSRHSAGDSSRDSALESKDRLKLTLSYRPPFDFDSLLRSYESHRMGNLEWFENGRMHRVIEFASMQARDGKIVDEYEQLYGGSDEIPPHIQVLTRIKPEAIAGAPIFEEKRKEVEEHIGAKTILVGQNLGFDIGMLK